MAERKGMGLSMFEKLCKAHPEHTTVLKKQYRMNKDILDLINSLIYQNMMIPANQETANQRIELIQFDNFHLTWLESIKSQSVSFLKLDKIIESIPLN